jgi:diguanylate cyclase (GGDEF)-like protein
MTGNRILVVDDDIGARRLTRVTLTRAGFDVVEAENGQKALDILRSGMTDLVLLDVSMPVMDGFTACAELRALPGGEAVPVMMMTGLDDVQSIDHAFRVGATDFITKPINWPILPHRVRYMLRASAAINSLHESQRRLSNAQRIGDMGDWLWSVADNRIVPSEQAWRILGLDPAHAMLTHELLLDCVHLEDRNRVAAAFAHGLADGHGFAVQHRVVQPGGRVRQVHQQIEVIECDSQGRAVQLVGAIHDVTQRTDAEEQIRRLAYYDTLTGLPNRLLFMQQLQTALGYAERHGQKVALMFVDLDNFKRVNDTMGHGAGDELLQAVSARLVNSIRVLDSVSRISALDGDGPSIARLGGDEFTVMVSEVGGADEAAVVARRLVDALAQPLTVQGTELFVGGSVGIALYPDDGADIQTLLKNADTAMYRAKESRKGSFHFYDPSMTERAMQRLATETLLRHAIEREELRLMFQPRVDLKTQRIVGAEALLRWQHPERGLVGPEEFIGLAEECGLIVAIGEWVLSAACKQLARWRDAGQRPIPVAINLAASHLREPMLPASVAHALAFHGLPATLLEIEVTESVMLSDPEASIRNAVALSEFGVRLAIDDFGTGYSSLNYLKRLPVSCLKVDQSFIREMTVDASSAGIVTAIIAMAHTLDLTVVAEGVEHEAQLIALRARGCDQFQGFLFSRALPAPEFAALLAEKAAGSSAALLPAGSIDATVGALQP